MFELSRVFENFPNPSILNPYNIIVLDVQKCSKMDFDKKVSSFHLSGLFLGVGSNLKMLT